MSPVISERTADKMVTPEDPSPASPNMESEKSEKYYANRSAAADNPTDSTSTRRLDNGKDGQWFQKMGENSFLRRCWKIISYTPSRCRWNPENPPEFNLGLNLLFAFARLSFSYVLRTHLRFD